MHICVDACMHSNLHVIKYCDHPRWYEKHLQEMGTPMGWYHLQSEVSHLQFEISQPQSELF